MRKAFTLAVVGVVASLTIPPLTKSYQEAVWKTGYKQGISDANQAFLMLLADDEYSSLLGIGDPDQATINESNFEKIAEKLKAVKTCFNNDRFECWEQDGDCAQGTMSGGSYVDAGVCSYTDRYSFIDAKGRSWTMYNTVEAYMIFDINGFSGPNRLGRDRWAVRFTTKDDITANSGTPDKLIPYPSYDLDSPNRWCPLGDCKYRSYLLN